MSSLVGQELDGKGHHVGPDVWLPAWGHPARQPSGQDWQVKENNYSMEEKVLGFFNLLLQVSALLYKKLSLPYR